MASFTMELRELINYIGNFDYSAGEIKFKGWITDSIDLTKYLTADEIDVINTRGTWNPNELAQEIVDHFYTREIGSETIALFKKRFTQELKELMEYYAPIIYSQSIKFDPLVNVDYTETGSNSDSSSGLSVGSDTPQGQINKASILAGNYATSADANEGTSSGSYSKTVVGNSGVSATAQKMIEQYRDIIKTTYRDIIHDIERDNLFIGIYN